MAAGQAFGWEGLVGGRGQQPGEALWEDVHLHRQRDLLSQYSLYEHDELWHERVGPGPLRESLRRWRTSSLRTIEANLDTQDGDLGSGGPVLLPTQTLASGSTVSPLVEIGKSGAIYLLNRNNLGGFNAAGDQVYEGSANA